jgi:hypothetical protein
VAPQALRFGSNEMRSLFGPEQLVARRPSNTAQPTERAVKVIRTSRREDRIARTPTPRVGTIERLSDESIPRSGLTARSSAYA